MSVCLSVCLSVFMYECMSVCLFLMYVFNVCIAVVRHDGA
jgi:hypothetical protein